MALKNYKIAVVGVRVFVNKAVKKRRLEKSSVKIWLLLYKVCSKCSSS